MITLLRMLIFAAGGLCTAAAKAAGWYLFVPLGIGLGAGWLLARLVTPHLRSGVAALSLMGVQLLWGLLAFGVVSKGYETPVLGGIADALEVDLERFEVGGRFGILVYPLQFLRRNWDYSPSFCLGLEAILIALLAWALLRTAQRWPAVVACVVLSISALWLFFAMRHGEFGDAVPGVAGAVALRLIESCILLYGLTQSFAHLAHEQASREARSSTEPSRPKDRTRASLMFFTRRE